MSSSRFTATSIGSETEKARVYELARNWGLESERLPAQPAPLAVDAEPRYDEQARPVRRVSPSTIYRLRSLKRLGPLTTKNVLIRSGKTYHTD
jgi:hypothetical protein